MIKNIKSSLTVLCEKKWKFEIIKRLDQLKIFYRETGNILITKSSFNLCIFEKTRNLIDLHEKYGKETFYIHINLSGVSDFINKGKVENFISNSILKSSWKIVSSKIDNITSTFSLNEGIDLKNLFHKNTSICKYNSERFPGLFMKLEYGTCVAFKSGKVNLIGCKSAENVYKTWNHFQKILVHASA